MTELPSLKAGLHVHSYYSGYAGHLPIFKCRDSYSTPEEIYRQAKKRGMDLVTITDHNSIDGCLEFLNRHPDVSDFFIGEEVDCIFPDSPIRLHVESSLPFFPRRDHGSDLPRKFTPPFRGG